MALVRACTWQDDNWWIAHGLDITVSTQGGSYSEVVENLEEAISLHLEEPASLLCLPFSPPEGASIVEVKCERVQPCPPTATVQLPCPPLEARMAQSFRQVRLRLQSAGFTGINQRPMHAKFIKYENGYVRTAVLPHYRELSASVVRSIIWQAQLTWGEFEQLEAAF